jgi:lambda repressor-like predicted transcriptional regulator
MSIDTAAKKALSDPKTRRAAVKYHLDLMGLNMCDLAREYSEGGVRRSTVYNAFDTGYPKMERFIAAKFGMTAREMFPERFNSDGSRKRKKCGPKPKKSKGKRTSNARGRKIKKRAPDGHREAA